MAGMPNELLISQEETRIAGFSIELPPASTGNSYIQFGDLTRQTTAAVTPDLSVYALKSGATFDENAFISIPSTSNDIAIRVGQFVGESTWGIKVQSISDPYTKSSLSLTRIAVENEDESMEIRPDGIYFSDGTLPGAFLSGYYVRNIAYKTGATFTGKVNTTATITTAPLNIAVATTNPTTTVAGDIWVGTNNLFFKDSTNVQRALLNSNTVNTFTQPQIIATTTTATLPALRITNLATTSTAHSLVVEDTTNPDTTSLVVNNAGNVGIGVTPASWTPTEKLDINGYATSLTAPTIDSSTKLATTAFVKSSIRGEVINVGSSGWAIGGSVGGPNNIVRVYDDAPGGLMIIGTESPEYIPVGTQYVFIQTGTYSFSISTDGGGVQLRSFGNKFTSAGQHAVCTLIKTAPGEWYLAGNLA